MDFIFYILAPIAVIAPILLIVSQMARSPRLERDLHNAILKAEQEEHRFELR